MASGKILVPPIRVNHSIKFVTKSFVQAQNYTTLTRRFSEIGFLCYKDISNFERIDRDTMKLIMTLLAPDAKFKGTPVDNKFQVAAYELAKSVVHKSAEGRAGVLEHFNVLMAKRSTSSHKINSLIIIRCLLEFPESTEAAFKRYKVGKKSKIGITELAAMTLRDAVQLSFKVEGTDEEKEVEALIWQEIYVAMDILVKCNSFDQFANGKIPETLKKYNVLKFFAHDDPMNMESSLSKKENRPAYYNRIEDLSVQMIEICQEYGGCCNTPPPSSPTPPPPDPQIREKTRTEQLIMEETLKLVQQQNTPDDFAVTCSLARTGTFDEDVRQCAAQLNKMCRLAN